MAKLESYGYRPKKSALDAVAKARQRCWKYPWAIDLDIQGFFDHLDHELIMRAIQRQTTCRWILLYVEHWLKADVQEPDGTITKRVKGTPQGGVISPLLANIFMHYAFDLWMRRNHHSVLFERYADDVLVHCRTKQEAEKMLEKIKERLAECKLAVNMLKTRIVYCGVGQIKEDVQRSFNFLGYTFRPRRAYSKGGKLFTGFLPAISNQAKCGIRRTIKGWRLHRCITDTMETLAKRVNPCLRGWINYYGKYYRSEIGRPLLQVDHYLIRWIRSKYRRSTGTLGMRQALDHLGRVRRHQPHLFEHWCYGWIWTTD